MKPTLPFYPLTRSLFGCSSCNTSGATLRFLSGRFFLTLFLLFFWRALFFFFFFHDFLALFSLLVPLCCCRCCRKRRGMGRGLSQKGHKSRATQVTVTANNLHFNFSWTQTLCDCLALRGKMVTSRGIVTSHFSGTRGELRTDCSAT